MSRKGGRTTGCAASTSAKLVEGRSHKIASKTYKASNMPNFGDRSSDTECDDFPNKLNLMTATDTR